MDALKKDVLLELVTLINTRLDVLTAHLEYRRDEFRLKDSALGTPLKVVDRLRSDLSFLQANLESEPITLSGGTRLLPSLPVQPGQPGRINRPYRRKASPLNTGAKRP